MPINIKVGNQPPEPINVDVGEREKKIENPIKATLQIRKSLDGNIMIFDHEDIDIILIPEKSKILTYAKDIMSDKIYDTQNRLMKFLNKKGLVDASSIKSGNIFSSLESTISASEENKDKALEMMLLNISNWMEDERPTFMYSQAAEDQEEERLLHPDDEETTEFGEVPAERNKGVSGYPSPYN
jgi:hypothetical protein